METLFSEDVAKSFVDGETIVYTRKTMPVFWSVLGIMVQKKLGGKTNLESKKMMDTHVKSLLPPNFKNKMDFEKGGERNGFMTVMARTKVSFSFLLFYY